MTFFGSNMVGQEPWARRGEDWGGMVPANRVTPGTFPGGGDYIVPASMTLWGQGTPGTNFDWIHSMKTGAISPTNIRFSFSHRGSGTDFMLYGYDGSSFSVGQFIVQTGSMYSTGPVRADVARVGRQTFSDPGNVYAQFSYYTASAVNDYAILQHSDLTTFVNAGTGKTLWLRVGNVNRMHMGGVCTAMDAPLSLEAQTLWTKQANDNTHRIQHSTGLDSLELFTAGEFRFIDSGTLSATHGNGYFWLTGGGTFQGQWGTGGGGIRDRGSDNVCSFDWVGEFRMYVDTTHVKTFVIPHPTDEDRYLVHGTLEGPEAGVYYRGRSQLVDGWVQVDLPDYFEDLCEEEGRSVQLTCIADDPEDQWCPVLHATYPKKGRFFVGLGSGMVINDQQFWWEVKAVRRNTSLEVTPLKRNVKVAGDGPYTYVRRNV